MNTLVNAAHAPTAGDAVSLIAVADDGGLSPGASHGCQPGVLGDWETPPLVVRQMPVQGVEFVPFHQVQHFFDVPHGHHVAAAVYHQAPP